VLAEAMEELGIDQPVEVIDVRGEQEAQQLKFLGSPTIRVNGQDVDPAAREAIDYGMECRLYRTEEGTVGWPSKAMMLAALKAAV